jgi:colicin import membrane protein
MIERASDRWVSIALSVLLHGTLLVAVVYGFWIYRQSRPPIPTPTLAIQATVVDSRSLSGAAKTPTPQPPPPAPPVEAPPPEPVEPTGPPEPSPEELAQREQAQKEQAEKERVQQEQAQKERAEKEAAEQQRQVEAQKQQEEAQRQAEEKRQREAQEKAEAERKAEAQRKAEEAKKKAEEQRLAEQKRAEAAQREADQKEQAESEAELKNSLAAEERANQLRSNGAVQSWQAQISARIHRAWLQPPSARSGLECLLLVTQAPGGAVLSAKLESCNGDQAVRESLVAAAYRASPLPPPPDPSLFDPKVEVLFRLD